MSFLDTVRRVKAYLEEQGRVSLRALKREFELEDGALEELVEELVGVQQVAARDGKVVEWIGATGAEVGERAHAAAGEAACSAQPAVEAAEAERRQLTVLFCDLVDSTTLASRLDPEDWREVVRGYQEATAEVIERFEGYIAQYLGDGLLIYFGYPKAHEDDAERAVRAGREILGAIGKLNESFREAYALRLTARVGIHTGPVVVGEMGARGRKEALALGDTTNVAARIQALAEPDTLLVTSDTLGLVRGIFVTEDLGRHALKGIAEPVGVHRIVQPSGVRSRLDVAQAHLTRFVGRKQELGILIDRWEQAVEGQGQTVFLSGEAGLGRSRLALVLREHLADQPHTWLECRSSPYTQGSALYPVAELVRQGVAFGPEDTPEIKLRKIEAGVGLAGFEAPQAVPLMADLLDVPLDAACPPLQLSPELRRERTLETLIAWTLALAETQPVLLLIEDLHRCDPSSLELFGRLTDQIPTSRVLMVLTARPDFEVPWARPKNWTPIVLGRLRQRQAREIVASLSAARPLPEEAVGRIVERADGVPLFLEELTSAALEAERSGAPLTIPATLQDSLMARLDRLSAGKQVAQLAAVLGREFPYRLLDAVGDLEKTALRAGLDRLVEADLLFQRGVPPDATYTFKHALIQETAYESLLRKRRQEIHARVAQTLEERFAERVEAEPEVVARHYDEAGLVSEAIAHYRLAGERATQGSAHAEAIGHLTRGIELLETLPKTPERNRQDLQLRVAVGVPLLAVKGHGDPEVERAWARARELCEETTDAPELLHAVRGLATHHYVRGDLATGAELGEQVLALAKQTGETFPLIVAHSLVAQPLYFLGRHSESLEHFERAIALYEPTQHRSLGHVTGYDEGVVSRAFAAWCLWTLGHPDRAVQTGQSAVELAREVEHPLALAHALDWMARLHHLRGEREAAREWAEEAIVLSTELGFPIYLGFGTAVRGWTRADSPSGGEGVEEIQRGLRQLAATGTVVGTPYFLGLLAEAQWMVGRREDALGALKAALALGNDRPQPFNDPELLRLKGEMLLDEGDDAAQREAESCFHQAVELSSSQEAKSLELRAATSLARLWQRQGRNEAARSVLQPVYDWFSEGFDTQDLKGAKDLLGELS
jgi:class 3 adenylate cyclase/tetratricopeptide (TPR) repeat protein